MLAMATATWLSVVLMYLTLLVIVLFFFIARAINKRRKSDPPRLATIHSIHQNDRRVREDGIYQGDQS